MATAVNPAVGDTRDTSSGTWMFVGPDRKPRQGEVINGGWLLVAVPDMKFFPIGDGTPKADLAESLDNRIGRGA